VNAKEGGVLHISLCTSITISSSQFTFAEAKNGSGGAIYFGTDTGFSITNSVFQNCKSINFGGGAISTISTNNSRIIKNSNFSGNVGNDSKGNDYIDNCTLESSVSLYSVASISGIISSSSSIKFYHESTNLSVDCLLNSSCSESEVYVGTSGSDFFLCGVNSENPCADVDYTWSNRITMNSTIYILNGNHTVSGHRIVYSVPFSLVLEGSGFNVNDDESVYPVLDQKANTHIDGHWTYNLGSDVSQNITYRKLKILHTNIQGWYFASTKPNHRFQFEHCYFAEGITGYSWDENLFRLDMGV
jgi:hypothetical protein